MRNILNSIMGVVRRSAPVVAIATPATVAATNADAAGVGTIGENVLGELQGVGNLVVGAAFLAGIVLVGAGILKLKQASDSQGGQVKYSDGLWRIAVGAGLAALPVVTGVANDTIFGETNTTAPTVTGITINGGN